MDCSSPFYVKQVVPLRGRDTATNKHEITRNPTMDEDIRKNTPTEMTNEKWKMINGKLV